MERPSRSEMFRAKMKQEKENKTTTVEPSTANKLPTHKRIKTEKQEKTR